jgi:hypothetical protein
MKNYASVALSAGVALGLTLAGSARAEPTTQNDQQGSEAQRGLPAEQVRIAEATLNLENAFRDQFVQGKSDRDALAAPIAQVVQAMPEAARPKVQAHIDAILAGGARATAEMTPEQRARVAAPPETVSKTQAAIISGWGWPAATGWGGLGAFAWPATYMFGGGCGLGFGACGYGLGMGGWYW